MQAAKVLAEQPHRLHSAHSARSTAAASALVDITATEAGRRAVVTALTCVKGTIISLAELVKVMVYMHVCTLGIYGSKF